MENGFLAGTWRDGRRGVGQGMGMLVPAELAGHLQGVNEERSAVVVEVAAWKEGADCETARRSRTPKAAVTPLTFVEMSAPVKSEPNEIVFPSGVRVRVSASVDSEAPDRVIAALDGRR